MTFCAKMTMPDRSVKPSADACSFACTAVASQITTAPDARDVEVFFDMMKPKEHSLHEAGGNAEDNMPSMASLMAHMASTMQKDVDAEMPAAEVGYAVHADIMVATSQAVTSVASNAALNALDTDAEADDLLLQDAMPSAYTASLFASMSGPLQTSQNLLEPVVAETVHVSAPHFSAKEIDAMVNMLVERITVSDTKAHMVTVEVSLADTTLRGTSLQLTRSLDGLLAVNLVTNDAATFQTLVGAQIDLKARLESLDTGMVRVDISHANQEQNRDQNRRSAMYQAYLGNDDHDY